MNWQEVCNDPILRDLPYKIELNEWGKIVMSPASNFHGILQAALIRIMAKAREDGTIIAECSVKTAKGVKVADVAWASPAFRREQGKVHLTIRRRRFALKLSRLPIRPRTWKRNANFILPRVRKSSGFATSKAS